MKFLLAAAIAATALGVPSMVGFDVAHAGWKCEKIGTGGRVCDKWVKTPTTPTKPASLATAASPPKLINRPPPPDQAGVRKPAMR
jgi:hypothetical protein